MTMPIRRNRTLRGVAPKCLSARRPHRGVCTPWTSGVCFRASERGVRTRQQNWNGRGSHPVRPRRTVSMAARCSSGRRHDVLNSSGSGVSWGIRAPGGVEHHVLVFGHECGVHVDGHGDASGEALCDVEYFHVLWFVGVSLRAGADGGADPRVHGGVDLGVNSCGCAVRAHV